MAFSAETDQPTISRHLNQTVPTALVEIDEVNFAYGKRAILKGISLTVPRGKVVAIMGGSGCGKTTLLRLIGGQLRASSGRVLVNGQDVGTLAPEAMYAMRRKMGMLFQFGALFTDMSVFENVAFQLREHTDLPEDMISMGSSATARARATRRAMPPDSSEGISLAVPRRPTASSFIMVSGLFVGMVLGLQGFETLQKYGAEETMGVLVALSLVRELGPVVAALLFASRAGSAITAEIGLMKATEQLKAMDMMAIDPIARVVAPRFWAGVISMPLLAALFSAMGIFGGFIVGVALIDIDPGVFWSNMQAAVDFRYDVLNGFVKSVVFGIAVSIIATFEGFDAEPTAEGVSRATTRTVVTAALTVLLLDLILTAFMLRGIH